MPPRANPTKKKAGSKKSLETKTDDNDINVGGGNGNNDINQYDIDQMIGPKGSSSTQRINPFKQNGQTGGKSKAKKPSTKKPSTKKSSTKKRSSSKRKTVVKQHDGDEQKIDLNSDDDNKTRRQKGGRSKGKGKNNDDGGGGDSDGSDNNDDAHPDVDVDVDANVNTKSCKVKKSGQDGGDDSSQDENENESDNDDVENIDDDEEENDDEDAEISDDADDNEDDNGADEGQEEGGDECVYNNTSKKQKNVKKLFGKMERDDDPDDENTYDENGMIIDVYVDPKDRCANEFLTKYEVVRILGERTAQLAQGAKPMLKNVDDMDPRVVSQLELESRMVPFIICRQQPDGKKELWSFDEIVLKKKYIVYGFTGGEVNKKVVQIIKDTRDKGGNISGYTNLANVVNSKYGNILVPDGTNGFYATQHGGNGGSSSTTDPKPKKRTTKAKIDNNESDNENKNDDKNDDDEKTTLKRAKSSSKKTTKKPTKKSESKKGKSKKGKSKKGKSKKTDSD